MLWFLLGEVINNMQDLQSLTIDMSAEKEKQRANMKHILQQKQRALSDLFKMLTEIGECSIFIYMSCCADKSQKENKLVFLLISVPYGPIKVYHTGKA